MNEMILSWPNVALHWWDSRGSYAGFRLIPEIEKGQYGYRLTVGQTLHAIRYHGTNYDIFVNPHIEGIEPEGLMITHLLQREKQPLFVPFKKELPNGGKYELRDLYIEPCEHLYEKYRMNDLLDDTADEEGLGIWYKHGGWRCPGDRISKANLKNFVKLGQQTIFG